MKICLWDRDRYESTVISIIYDLSSTITGVSRESVVAWRLGVKSESLVNPRNWNIDFEGFSIEIFEFKVEQTVRVSFPGVTFDMNTGNLDRLWFLWLLYFS